jgi:hypothetical protein
MVCRYERRGKWGWPDEIHRVGKEGFQERRKENRGRDESLGRTRPESESWIPDDAKDLRKDESTGREDASGQEAKDASGQEAKDPRSLL